MDRLLAAGNGLRDAFVRNEHLIGLLPVDAEKVMVDAYRRADATGSREAALAWVRESYFRELEPADDAASRIDGLVADDPDGTAHVLRGWMRFNGYGFPRDATAAGSDHEVAALRGNPDALFEVSVLSATGQGFRSTSGGPGSSSSRRPTPVTRAPSTTSRPSTRRARPPAGPAASVRAVRDGRREGTREGGLHGRRHGADRRRHDGGRRASRCAAARCGGARVRRPGSGRPAACADGTAGRRCPRGALSQGGAHSARRRARGRVGHGRQGPPGAVATTDRAGR
ncbi:hypothetical protein NKG05_12980 [Oerskovia sp. M15]